MEYNVNRLTSEVPTTIHCPYSVGTTTDGRTVLKVHDESGFTTITLVMNEHATLQMIRMLESTLPAHD